MSNLDTLPVRRSARVLSAALLVFAAGLGVAVCALAGWLVVDARAAGAVLGQALGQAAADLRPWQGIALGLLAMGQLAVWAWIAAIAHGGFVALQASDLTAAARAARRSARLFWVVLALGIAAHPMGTLIATWHAPVGERVVAISLGSAHVTAVMAALLASFAAHALSLGAALWHDHRSVI